MVFAHDTERALASMAALVNTSGPPEQLADATALTGFVDRWRWSGPVQGDPAELAAVRQLRARLHQLWQLDVDGAVALVNELLSGAGAMPQLVRHDEWDYHVHATALDAPLADRMACEAGMAMVDVIRQGELSRLGICSADWCDDVLVDLSKNRSRRFCGTSCANRVNVAAFRARRSTAASSAAT